jgi:hypothetical protein
MEASGHLHAPDDDDDDEGKSLYFLTEHNAMKAY